jgi:N-acetylglucosaminyl-diphospho-decaprenol L-rhamnosyltransferase
LEVNLNRARLPGPVTLSIICVNWNSLRYLLDCIASIYEHPPAVQFEIVVVDNASPEGGLEKLEEKFPLVRLIKSDRNIGFAGANNLGIRHSSGQYILLLNPDTKIVGSAISILLDHIASLTDAGVVGGTLLNGDLSVSTMSIQKFPTILNQFFTAEWLRLRYPSLPLWDIAPLFSKSLAPLRVDVIPGACMMLRRDLLEQVGLLTEDYFMYAEDIDLNYKIRKLGYASYYVAEAQVIHYGGSSSRQQASQWSTLMTCRAMLRYFRTNRGFLYASLYRASMGWAALFRLTLLAIVRPFDRAQSFGYAAAKWSTILRWSVGIGQV